MIQARQPKKVKGARKKAREEIIERLQLKFPTWFEGKTDKEIKNLITAFRLSGRSDDEFPNYCLEYEAEMEKLSKSMQDQIKKISDREKEELKMREMIRSIGRGKSNGK